MTRFEPPPQGPDGTYPAESARAEARGSFDPRSGDRPTRWSVAAVSGFILSFLGCTGIGAVLGLVLGIIGIVTTRGGRQRGMGLAIAAIPISLTTGLVALLLGVVFSFAANMVRLSEENLPAILGADASSTAEPAGLLLSLAGPELREEVDRDSVQAWLAQIAEKHGKCANVASTQGRPIGSTPDGHPFLSFDGGFVNGPANIKVTFDSKNLFGTPKIVDIEVDGVSLREWDTRVTIDD